MPKIYGAATHTSARAGRATYLVVPEIEGPKTVIGNPVERLGEFGNHLVIPRAGTEYYLLIDKADQTRKVTRIRFLGNAKQVRRVDQPAAKNQ